SVTRAPTGPSCEERNAARLPSREIAAECSVPLNAVKRWKRALASGFRQKESVLRSHQRATTDAAATIAASTAIDLRPAREENQDRAGRLRRFPSVSAETRAAASRYRSSGSRERVRESTCPARRDVPGGGDTPCAPGGSVCGRRPKSNW